jgi:hypothetical protein
MAMAAPTGFTTMNPYAAYGQPAMYGAYGGA